MNLVPWHSKPHPRLRFTSLTPDAHNATARAAAALPPLSSASRSSVTGGGALNATLGDIEALTKASKASQ